METIRITKSDVAVRNGRIKYVGKPIPSDANIEIDDGLTTINFDSICIEGRLWAKIGSGIMVSEGITAKGGIISGLGITAGWGIASEESIEAGWGIYAGRGIAVESTITAGGGITAEWDIVTSSSILAGGGIAAGDGIKAGGGITAGESIEAKWISCEYRICAGTSPYTVPSNEDRQIRVQEIRKGTVYCGELVITKEGKNANTGEV